MKICFLLLILCSILGSCKQKDTGPKKNYISVVSLVRDQVKHIDTALYTITRIVTIDTLTPDTSFISRENFAAAAEEFLSIPDLDDQKVARNFTEEPARYDQQMNRVIITYVPVNAEKEVIKKQELIVKPNPAAGDEVKNIFINSVINNRDSFVEKKMLWNLNRYFQIITIQQKPGRPQLITTTKVTWNEGTDQ